MNIFVSKKHYQPVALLLFLLTSGFANAYSMPVTYIVAPNIPKDVVDPDDPSINDTIIYHNDGRITINYDHIMYYVKHTFSHNAQVGYDISGSDGTRTRTCKLPPGYSTAFVDGTLSVKQLTRYCVPVGSSYYVASGPYIDLNADSGIDMSLGSVYAVTALEQNVIALGELSLPDLSMCDGTVEGCYVQAGGGAAGPGVTITDRYGSGVEFFSGEVGYNDGCVGLFVITVCI